MGGEPPSGPQSGSELERFFDLALDLLVIAGFDGYLKRVNPAYERTLGYAMEELLARPLLFVVHPDDVESVGAVLSGLRDGDDVIEFENRVICADGSVRWLQWNTRAMPEREIVYGVGRDVTERRLADAELREAQQMLEASRAELHVLAEEQAALRRVATLVAKAVPSSELFDAVVREVGTLLDSDFSGLVCFEDDAVVPVATWAAVGELPSLPAGWPIHPDDPLTMIAETSQPVRWEDMTATEGPLGVFIREMGVRSAVTCPIVVEDRLWGALGVSSKRSGSLPPDTESRLAQFSDLVATAFANAEARAEVARLAREQVALRRVATLVARERPPEEVFASVAEEVGRVLGVADTLMWRHEPDGSATVVAVWTKHGSAPIRLGSRMRPGGRNVASLVFRTGQPARIDAYIETATGPIGERMAAAGVGSAVGAPIVVEGRVWGSMIAATRESGPLPAGSESRIEKFTELVATAISNMQARSDLAASRARIVAAADDERRRVVRDLHDGAQQRLVHTTITLKLAEQALQNDEENAPALVNEALGHAERATAELRELSHGILPAVLTDGGLRAGVEALGSRMPLPVRNGVSVGRLPAVVEATAYFVVCEALTNVVKHAHAGHAEVTARIEDGLLAVHVRDDGVGGARPDGSGLVGLADRLAALDGLLRVEAASGGGTLIAAAIPLTGSGGKL